MIALVAGATGLVGGQLLRQLADDPRYHAVTALVRRPLPPALRRERVRQVTVDYDRLADRAADLAADHVFCALGTTIRDAGSRDRFRRVDHDYPRDLARLARDAGARHFALVSAVGANARSRVFYNRVKGEAEAAVRAVDYPSGALFRPSILGGRREIGRPMERLGQRIAALVPGRYRLVPAADVAAAMIAVAAREPAAWRIVESEEIRAIAAGRAS
ncbi:MAG TPA: NAD(P)H-binding protein [Longimicrobiales bacterium]|nr:NAD(P)H-binding protein [Longimicrobiales bacterium]